LQGPGSPRRAGRLAWQLSVLCRRGGVRLDAARARDTPLVDDDLQALQREATFLDEAIMSRARSIAKRVTDARFGKGQRAPWMPGRFMNAEERAQLYPASFQIPTREERDALSPGDVAKLAFMIDRLPNGCDGERMWVKVTGVANEGARGIFFVGVLESKPLYLDLQPGVEVRFQAHQVLDIEREPAKVLS
jgi:hypothetical protein